MHSLINRAIEEFLRSTYGDDLVRAVADEGETSAGRFATDAGLMDGQALERAAFRMAKPQSEMFEDLGAWLTRLESVRRLLRFSGRDFRDFLLRLDELPGRAHLVLPDLAVPRLQVEAADLSVWLILLHPDPTWQHVLIGLIRGMADDYGALCLIATEDAAIRIDIWDEQFAEGRHFMLNDAIGAAQ